MSPLTCPIRVNQDQDVIPIDNNTETLAMAKEQDRFSEGCENPRGCGQAKRYNLPLIWHIGPNKL